MVRKAEKASKCYMSEGLDLETQIRLLNCIKCWINITSFSCFCPKCCYVKPIRIPYSLNSTASSLFMWLWGHRSRPSVGITKKKKKSLLLWEIIQNGNLNLCQFALISVESVLLSWLPNKSLNHFIS